MLEFRLKVFYVVAKRLSFTKAATELFISQPAVTKHIRELEALYKTKLFERGGNRKIALTHSGELMLQSVNELMEIHRQLEFDINLLNNKHKGLLRLGASTTIAQYVIPIVLAKFHQSFVDVEVELITGNTEEIELAVAKKQIELGIVEGFSKSPAFKYTEFLRDELVLTCAMTNKELVKDTIKPVDLLEHPMLLREPGSGTLEVLANSLQKLNIKIADLNVEMQLGSTEGIKSYLVNSNCIAFLSVHAILKELKNKELRIIDVKGLQTDRQFNFIQQHGQSSALTELFMRFAHKLPLI